MVMLAIHLIGLVAVSVPNMPHGFDVAYCNAENSYQCGLQVGEQMKDSIQSVALSRDNQRLVAYVTTGAGAAIYKRIVALNKARYPDIHDEIKGLADGAGVAVDALLTINLSDILAGFFATKASAPKVKAAKQCTDVHAITSSFQGWAHNEDEFPQPYYLVYSNITRAATATAAATPATPATPAAATTTTSSEEEVYVGFAYAGVVVGWAWGFNAHVGQSINAIPIDANATTMGVSINYVGRDALRATTVQDAIARTSVANQATAAHFNFGSYAAPSLHVSVETAPSNASGPSAWAPVSTRWINASTVDANMRPGAPVAGHYMHVNLYRRLNAPITPFGPSSAHRLARIKTLPPPETRHDLLAMLSDTADADYPIWRNDSSFDGCNTLATVLYDTGSAEVTIFGKQPVDPNSGSTLPSAAGALASPSVDTAGRRKSKQSKQSQTVLVFDWKRPETWEAVLRA